MTESGPEVGAARGKSQEESHEDSLRPFRYWILCRINQVDRFELTIKEEKLSSRWICDVNFAGVDSISMDMKDKKLTVTGDIDPVGLVSKLRKICPADILSVGPAKEPEKKKDEPKKEEAKKPDDKKKDPKDEVANLLQAYQAYHAYNSRMPQQHYYVRSAEEDPNACVIC